MGIVAVIIGVSVGVVFYQVYYLPESLQRPDVPHEILEPHETFHILIVEGAITEGNDNYVPSSPTITLGQNNLVVWTNEDSAGHTVTPEPYEDRYSGKFGSTGLLSTGETYEFLFTEPASIKYHCEPHPWMQAEVTIERQRF